MADQISLIKVKEFESQDLGSDGAPVLMGLRYGNEVGLDEDVDLFQVFYTKHYGREAATKIYDKMRGSQRTIGIGCVAVGIAATFPKLVFQMTSPFAITLLITALMLIGYGGYKLWQARKPYDPTDEGIAELLYEEFKGARTKRNRIFDLFVTTKGIETTHGVKTGGKQRHYKAYEDMTCVDITDDLIFVKGITWFCRFLLGEERFERLASILKENCGSVVNDERTGASAPAASSVGALPLAQEVSEE